MESTKVFYIWALALSVLRKSSTSVLCGPTAEAGRRGARAPAFTILSLGFGFRVQDLGFPIRPWHQKTKQLPTMIQHEPSFQFLLLNSRLFSC